MISDQINVLWVVCVLLCFLSKLKIGVKNFIIIQ